jgi:hypothetical protein
MSKIFTMLILILAAGCSSRPVLRKPPCDAVVGRENVYVCGKDEVMKGCVLDTVHNEWVCNKL